MEFSEKEIYLIGAVIGMLASLPLIILIGKSSVKNLKRDDVKNKITWKSYFSFLLYPLIFYCLSILFHYTVVITLIAIGCIVEGIALYAYLNKFSLSQSGKKKGNIEEKRALIYISLTMLTFIPLICLATISGTQWLMPDVTVITKSDNTFEAKEYYVIPYTHDTRPGGSYIHNETSDTIFRIIIKYAYLGEELHNKFAIEDEYTPGQVALMRSRANYAMKIIPLVMLPSSNRTGRYHTRLVFLTERNHMDAFHKLDMTEFGLMENLLVDSVAPDRDHTMREDSSLYNAYKVINPDPYKNHQ